jgi:hypothetical protein
LTSLPDVKGAEARALTGSVVIHHQGPWSETAEQISEAGLFVIAEEDAAAIPLNIFGPDARSEIAKHLSRTGFFVENEQQALKSLESMAPPLIAAGGAAALALLQIARGHALPPAITLLMYARALAGPFIATLSKE